MYSRSKLLSTSTEVNMLRATGPNVLEAFIRLVKQFRLKTKYPLSSGVGGSRNRMNMSGMVGGYFYTGYAEEVAMIAAYQADTGFEFHATRPIEGVPMEERDNSRGGYRYRIQFVAGVR